MPHSKFFGWLSDYPTLRAASPKDVVRFLRDFLHEANPTQFRSWSETVPITQRETGQVVDAVEAGRLLFNREPLPRIKRARSARIPEIMDLILSICHEAAATRTRQLVVLTGAPGSGKNPCRPPGGP